MEKTNSNRKHIIISSLLILSPILVGLFLWNRLPERIPTHFGFNGEADQYGSKAFTVFFMPIFMLFIHWLMVWGTMKDPKHERVSDKVYTLIIYSVPLISIFVNMTIYLRAFDQNFDITRAIMCLVSFIFIVIGNYRPKTRQNYTIGIKLPWTLEDQENWDKVHRLAGYLFMTAGVAMFISIFFPGYTMIYVMLAVTILATIIPVIYSYRLYQEKKAD